MELEHFVNFVKSKTFNPTYIGLLSVKTGFIFTEYFL